MPTYSSEIYIYFKTISNFQIQSNLQIVKCNGLICIGEEMSFLSLIIVQCLEIFTNDQLVFISLLPKSDLFHLEVLGILNEAL